MVSLEDVPHSILAICLELLLKMTDFWSLVDEFLGPKRESVLVAWMVVVTILLVGYTTYNCFELCSALLCSVGLGYATWKELVDAESQQNLLRMLETVPLDRILGAILRYAEENEVWDYVKRTIAMLLVAVALIHVLYCTLRGILYTLDALRRLIEGVCSRPSVVLMCIIFVAWQQMGGLNFAEILMSRLKTQ